MRSEDLDYRAELRQGRGGPQAALHPSAPFQRALVVANPIAGRGQAAKVGTELAEGLRRLGVSSQLHMTRARGDCRARLRCLEEDVDLVVSVGGDGTLREVFDGLCNPEVAVAVVPLGTANVLSLDLGLPRDVDGALEVIARRRLIRIDVAEVNGHLSFLVTGVGLDGMIVRELEGRRSGPISKLHYVSAGLRAARAYQPPELRVEIEGEEQPGTYGLVLISNIVHYGGFLQLSPERKLDDGLYEVYLFPDGRLRKIAQAAARGLLGHLRDGRACRVVRARRVRVTSQTPVAYHVDGDYRGETPVDFSVTRRQAHLLVP